MPEPLDTLAREIADGIKKKSAFADRERPFFSCRTTFAGELVGSSKDLVELYTLYEWQELYDFTQTQLESLIKTRLNDMRISYQSNQVAA